MQVGFERGAPPLLSTSLGPIPPESPSPFVCLPTPKLAMLLGSAIPITPRDGRPEGRSRPRGRLGCSRSDARSDLHPVSPWRPRGGAEGFPPPLRARVVSSCPLGVTSTSVSPASLWADAWLPLFSGTPNGAAFVSCSSRREHRRSSSGWWFVLFVGHGKISGCPPETALRLPPQGTSQSRIQGLRLPPASVGGFVW